MKKKKEEGKEGKIMRKRMRPWKDKERPTRNRMKGIRLVLYVKKEKSYCMFFPLR